MGGIPCIIPRNAALGRFANGYPTIPADVHEFNERARRALRSDNVANGIGELGEEVGDRICELLADDKWTGEQSREVYDILKRLDEY